MVMMSSPWATSEYAGQDEVAVDDEFRYIFWLLMRMSDEDEHYKTDTSPGAEEYSHGTAAMGAEDFSDTEARNTEYIDRFIDTEGGGIIIYQVPTYLPPEDVNPDSANYGFLDPSKAFQFGTLAQYVQATPVDPVRMGEEIYAEMGYSYGTSAEYTTNDLAGGWTWTASADDRYYDGNFYMAASDSYGDLLQNYTKFASTLIYEATVVNWFDSVALRAQTTLDKWDEEYDTLPHDSDVGDVYETEYGKALIGSRFFDFDDEDDVDIVLGYESTFYAYEQLSENIALQSESVRSVAPRIIRAGESDDGKLWIDPLDAAGDAAASAHARYAEWPWLNYRDGISAGFIEDIWAALSFPDYGTLEDDSTYTIPLIYQDPEMSIALLNRWRKWETVASDAHIAPKGEKFYYNTRVSAAVNELGPTLYYATLPMKFVVKAQSSRAINKNSLSSLTYTADEPSSESPSGATMSEGAPDGGTY